MTSHNGGVILAASAAAASAAAAAAAAWLELEHRRVLSADLPAAHVRVERLSDLRSDKAALTAIEEGLRQEWGAFGLLGFDSAADMAREAGQTIFIASLIEEGAKTPIGSLQTILADCHGDPELLGAEYSDFAALTDRKAWRQSRRRGGDTSVLLQITVFAKDGRGGGIGSLLRDAVLHMLPEDVRFALTATPADGDAVSLGDKTTFNPAMRFHLKGGAAPTIVLRNYKPPAAGETPSVHGKDVVVMRYARDDEGHWPVPEPEMHTRRMGPVQLQVTYAARKLEHWSRRGEEAIKGLAARRRARVHAAEAKRWVLGQANAIAERSRTLMTRPERGHASETAADAAS
jgi:hypothetical protein